MCPYRGPPKMFCSSGFPLNQPPTGHLKRDTQKSPICLACGISNLGVLGMKHCNFHGCQPSPYVVRFLGFSAVPAKRRNICTFSRGSEHSPGKLDGFGSSPRDPFEPRLPARRFVCADERTCLQAVARNLNEHTFSPLAQGLLLG